ncbi:hypothetical protein FA09DRAFT_328310 [Tilletiopsis washingtonensis]|uniref:Mediator of RNA polymerase II transcription subunit 31 n=1 Tax=Tilletiopsis washingtonensis TaxID=58919 RepID=A0A316ZEL6_9BASI|nr:hypothetical protein FA09DRAFT_328310 [Tilletiopsis washingtonensis]PWO00208.1 hypothetical protein FA09DRAFT_328310 [Tilletiopsis washingtonensis]
MAEPDAPSSPPELSSEERALAYNRAVNLHRFTADLELLSALASPAYLVHLAHTGCLHDAAFLRYLARLEATWRQPQYARFLRYPNALFFLAALRRPEFRNAVGSEEWAREAALMVNKTWEGARAPRPAAAGENGAAPETSSIAGGDEEMLHVGS